MTNDIAELNEKYFELYSRVNEHRAFVSNAGYRMMITALDRMYESELKALTDMLALLNAEAKFERKYKKKHYRPKRKFLKLNRVGKAYRRKYEAEYEAFIALLEDEANHPLVPQEFVKYPQGFSDEPMNAQTRDVAIRNDWED